MVRSLVLESEEGSHSSDKWCCSGQVAPSHVTLAEDLLLTIDNWGPIDSRRILPHLQLPKGIFIGGVAWENYRQTVPQRAWAVCGKPGGQSAAAPVCSRFSVCPIVSARLGKHLFTKHLHFTSSYEFLPSLWSPRPWHLLCRFSMGLKPDWEPLIAVWRFYIYKTKFIFLLLPCLLST